jgi:hypothetical protein
MPLARRVGPGVFSCATADGLALLLSAFAPAALLPHRRNSSPQPPRSTTPLRYPYHVATSLEPPREAMRAARRGAQCRGRARRPRGLGKPRDPLARGAKREEAPPGFEPGNGGFAIHCLNPLGYGADVVNVGILHRTCRRDKPDRPVTASAHGERSLPAPARPQDEGMENSGKVESFRRGTATGEAALARLGPIPPLAHLRVS